MNSANDSRSGQSRDHRRSRRVDIRGKVAGQIVPSGSPIKIRDIGFGGFMMESDFPVSAGATHKFQFESDNGATFVLTARVAHSRLVSAPGDSPVYLTGLEFVDKDTKKGKKLIDVLIGKVTSVLVFPSRST